MPVNLLHLPKRDINEYFSPTTGIKKSSYRLTNVFMMKTIEREKFHFYFSHVKHP